MGRYQILGIAVALLLGSGFMWLHEHDKRVRVEALATNRAKELAVDDKQIKGLRESLVRLNSEYSKQRSVYVAHQKALNDSLPKLEKQIGLLAHQIGNFLPDSAKYLGDKLTFACQQSSDILKAQLMVCDSLRVAAEDLVAKGDTVQWRLQAARDNYKNLYELTRGYSPPSHIWATIGKFEASVGLIAVLSKLIHLW